MYNKWWLHCSQHYVAGAGHALHICSATLLWTFWPARGGKAFDSARMWDGGQRDLSCTREQLCSGVCTVAGWGYGCEVWAGHPSPTDNTRHMQSGRGRYRIWTQLYSLPAILWALSLVCMFQGHLCMSADARARALVAAAVTAAGAAHVPALLLLWGTAPWLCWCMG
jgi:hypothetical protein